MTESRLRRDALERSVRAWLATLNEADLRRVDDLVMYFVARNEEQRDEGELAELELKPPKPLARVIVSDDWDLAPLAEGG